MKFQLPPPKRLSTVIKNILGGHDAPPPCQIGLSLSLISHLHFPQSDENNLFLLSPCLKPWQTKKSTGMF